VIEWEERSPALSFLLEAGRRAVTTRFRDGDHTWLALFPKERQWASRDAAR
jgi:hypothetical protein